MSTTNPSDKTALLVMDVQPSTVERYAQNSDLLARLAKTIAAARAATIPVIYVRVKFRQGVVC
jgi:nicotinamidase-related amidase